jgi:uncharacterized protein (TIGR02246 family)
MLMSFVPRTGLAAALWLLPFLVFTAEIDVPAERGRDIRQIQESTRAWITAYQEGDIDSLMSLYTPDATLYISGKQALRGVDDIRAYFEPRLGQYEFKLTVRQEEYLFHGDLIIDVSLVWIDGRNTETGQSFQDAVRSLVMFRRTAPGDWKIYRDMDQHTQDTSRSE